MLYLFEVIDNIARGSNDVQIERVVAEQLERFPGSDPTVLEFIFRTVYHLGAENARCIESLFMGGYCYYFAVMLKTAFNRGMLCWNGSSHIVWLDGNSVLNDVAYDARGVSWDYEALIPVEALKDGIWDFMRVPGKVYNASEEEITKLLESYKGVDILDSTGPALCPKQPQLGGIRSVFERASGDHEIAVNNNRSYDKSLIYLLTGNGVYDVCDAKNMWVHNGAWDPLTTGHDIYNRILLSVSTSTTNVVLADVLEFDESQITGYKDGVRYEQLVHANDVVGVLLGMAKGDRAETIERSIFILCSNDGILRASSSELNQLFECTKEYNVSVIVVAGSIDDIIEMPDGVKCCYAENNREVLSITYGNINTTIDISDKGAPSEIKKVPGGSRNGRSLMSLITGTSEYNNIGLNVVCINSKPEDVNWVSDQMYNRIVGQLDLTVNDILYARQYDQCAYDVVGFRRGVQHHGGLHDIDACLDYFDRIADGIVREYQGCGVGCNNWTEYENFTGTLEDRLILVIPGNGDTIKARFSKIMKIMEYSFRLKMCVIVVSDKSSEMTNMSCDVDYGTGVMDGTDLYMYYSNMKVVTDLSQML